MPKKGKYRKLIILLILFVSPVLYIALGWTVVLGGSWLFLPNPSQPEITHGEFPFEIVLEIDGVTKTISDAYVCEYDGIGAGSNGKYIKWKGYIKSTGEEDIILVYEDNQQICCSVGSPEYYMNDPDHVQYEKNYPKVFYKKPHEMGGVSYGLISESELLAKYKIKIINWNFSNPIENSFE